MFEAGAKKRPLPIRLAKPQAMVPFKRMRIEHLHKMGHAPQARHTPPMSSVLCQWFNNRAGDLVTQGPQAPSRLESAETDFAAFLSSDIVPDWPGLLLDKAMSLHLDDMVLMCSKDVTGLRKTDSEHNRRLLRQAYSSVL